MNLRRRLSTAVLLSCSLALAACKVGPDHEAPKTRTADAFDAKAQAQADEKALAAWWDTLGDPTLSSLVEEALANSPDMKIAAARVREYQANLRSADGLLWPSVSADASYSRSGAGNGSGADTFRGGLSASWELDVFGVNRRAIEAAGADLAQQVEQERATRVGLAANVATAYILLQSNTQRLVILKANLALQEETLKLAETLFKAGLATEAPVAQAKAQLANQRALVAPLEQTLAQGRYALAALVGRQPQKGVAVAATPKAPLDPSAVIPVGMPSDLLRRRPDVRAAERALAASTARIGVAKGELFPRFALTGGLHQVSADAGDFFDPASRVWSIGPSVSVPLFNREFLKAQVRAADARAEGAVAGYEKAVLTALADAESALVACDKGRVQFAAQVDALAANQRSRDLTRELYEKGLGNFLDVLVADQSVFNAQAQLEQVRAQQAINVISLYKAVGGGWEMPPPDKKR